MTALFVIGDVHERLAEIPDRSVDLLLCSPPFLALRSYLPVDHPDKAREIGSEATPARYLDVLLELTAEWARVLAPHGSIAVELGDTMSGSGGAGGDYGPDGLRAGQGTFAGSAKARRTADDYSIRDDYPRPSRSGRARRDRRHQRGGDEHWKGTKDGWPLDKSLCGIPQAYQLSLAYGRNILRAPLSGRELLDEAREWVEKMADEGVGLTVGGVLAYLDAILSDHEAAGPVIEYEPWRVRTVKPWIRSNPPVGALGDKERPATSYVVVATRARDRYFDLDAVRTRPNTKPQRRFSTVPRTVAGQPAQPSDGLRDEPGLDGNAAGAPPRDWWHHVDAVLDAELTRRSRKAPDLRNGSHPGGVTPGIGTQDKGTNLGDKHEAGAQGVHLRRALERAGILRTLEAVDVSPKGYAGAHYAVWPPELVRLLVDEMCPRQVCTTCGQPSRRITSDPTYEASATYRGGSLLSESERVHRQVNQWRGANGAKASVVRTTTTVGWSDCGHDTWRAGLVLDPFVGSGTTLAVCTGMARDAIGIDIDMRNALLALDRVGMFLTIDWPPPDFTLPTLPAGSTDRARYQPWIHRVGAAGRRVRHVRGTDDEPQAPIRPRSRQWHRPTVTVPAPILQPDPSLFDPHPEEVASA
jgi:hypothetical protein